MKVSYQKDFKWTIQTFDSFGPSFVTWLMTVHFGSKDRQLSFWSIFFDANYRMVWLETVYFRRIIFFPVTIKFDNCSLKRPSTSDLALFNYNFRIHFELKLWLKQARCRVFKWLMKYRDQTPEIIQHMIRHVTESDTDLEKIAIGIEIVIEENVAIVIDQKRLRDPKG